MEIFSCPCRSSSSLYTIINLFWIYIFGIRELVGPSSLLGLYKWKFVCSCSLHCYKTWGAIPPAWSDDTILNLQADGIYFRQVWFLNTLSLPNLSDVIGYFWYWYTPPPAPWTDFCNKMQLYFVHVLRDACTVHIGDLNLDLLFCLPHFYPYTTGD